jgi:predicted dehydrogenase
MSGKPIVSGRKVRVGVVGAGWWSGRVHLPTIVDDPLAELAVIYDRTAARAQDAAERFGARAAATNVEELIDHDLDVALISTANHVHHEHAAGLLDAGIDVLIEKPMTVDPVQAWDLVERAERSGSRLHVGYTFVHSPLAMELRNRIRSGEIGDVVLSTTLFATAIQRMLRGGPGQASSAQVPYSPSAATWSDPHTGGGQVHGQLTHATSLLLWLLDAVPLEVAAFSDALGAKVDLVDALTVRTLGTGMASLSTTATVVGHDERVEEYRIFGTDGHFRLDTREWRYDLVTPSGALSAANPDPAAMMALCERAPVRTLVRAARGEADVVADGILGARTTSLLCAALEAAEQRTTVAVARSMADARPGATAR